MIVLTLGLFSATIFDKIKSYSYACMFLLETLLIVLLTIVLNQTVEVVVYLDLGILKV